MADVEKAREVLVRAQEATGTSTLTHKLIGQALAALGDEREETWLPTYEVDTPWGSPRWGVKRTDNVWVGWISCEELARRTARLPQLERVERAAKRLVDLIQFRGGEGIQEKPGVSYRDARLAIEALSSILEQKP